MFWKLYTNKWLWGQLIVRIFYRFFVVAYLERAITKINKSQKMQLHRAIAGAQIIAP